MTLRLNGATSGYTEIDAPAVAGSNTLVLPGGNGSADQALVTNGSGTLSFADRGRMVLETAKAYNWNSLTTNTSLDFTSIPSWVKRITVMFDGVGTSSTSFKLLQLGDSGGIETTGYTSGASNAAGGGGFATSTSGFVLSVSTNSSNAETMFGAIILTNVASNTWVAQGAFHMPTYQVGNFVAGGKALSGTLDRIRITTVNGTDTFDAGTINIMYEG